MVKECKKISERLKSGLSKLRYSPSITVDIWTDAGTIKKAVEEKLGEYGILLSDVFKTVTDGGTNIIAAFDTPYMSINMVLKIEVKF